MSDPVVDSNDHTPRSVATSPSSHHPFLRDTALQEVPRPPPPSSPDLNAALSDLNKPARGESILNYRTIRVIDCSTYVNPYSDSEEAERLPAIAICDGTLRAALVPKARPPLPSQAFPARRSSLFMTPPDVSEGPLSLTPPETSSCTHPAAAPNAAIAIAPHAAHPSAPRTIGTRQVSSPPSHPAFSRPPVNAIDFADPSRSTSPSSVPVLPHDVKIRSTPSTPCVPADEKNASKQHEACPFAANDTIPTSILRPSPKLNDVRELWQKAPGPTRRCSSSNSILIWPDSPPRPLSSAALQARPLSAPVSSDDDKSTSGKRVSWIPGDDLEWLPTMGTPPDVHPPPPSPTSTRTRRLYRAITEAVSPMLDAWRGETMGAIHVLRRKATEVEQEMKAVKSYVKETREQEDWTQMALEERDAKRQADQVCRDWEWRETLVRPLQEQLDELRSRIESLSADNLRLRRENSTLGAQVMRMELVLINGLR
ncbi:unnamed protein product [Cutaneotrichosporon oleaginosum]